jgi:hypothetical protein
MTISSSRSPLLIAPDQRPVAPDRPRLRTVEFADDGREETGPGAATADDFFVDWQLGVAVGARR